MEPVETTTISPTPSPPAVGARHSRRFAVLAGRWGLIAALAALADLLRHQVI